MAATAIPELIVPGELYIPDGKVGGSIAAGALPNGDDAFLLSEEAGVEDFQAYQDSIGAGAAARADHLLVESECAMSFWIRRRQSFDSWVSLPVNAITSNSLGSPTRFIMGVMDPNALALNTPAEKTISWAWVTYSSSQIQFIMNGQWSTNGAYWATSIQALLTANTWHFIVLNRDAYAFDGSDGGLFQLYQDGNLLAANTYPTWRLEPNPVAPQRFGIGDITSGGRTAGGDVAGPAWDIAKLAFHDRKLTIQEMQAMLDSMRYGPPS